MTRLFDQKGIAHLLIIGVVVVLAVVGFVGYRVMTQDDDKATTSTSTPDSIESNDDITQAEDALNSDQINDDLDPSQLDADIDDLL